MKRNLFFCLVFLLLFSSCLRGNNKKVIFETSKKVTQESLNTAKALNSIFDPQINKENSLIVTAKKWYVNTLEYKPKKIVDFASLQELLDGINRGKALNRVNDASLLLKKSGIKDLWNE